MSALFHRNLRAALPVAVRGEGHYLIDRNGKRYLDASGGAAVSCVGHDHPKVIAAIQHQVAHMAYAHTSFFTNEPAEKLATHMIARAPSGFGNGRAVFVSSGSEAIEVALKLARQYFVEKGQPQRSHFIARSMSYHGNTLGALSVGGHMQRRAAFQPMLMPATHIAPCYPYRFKRQEETDEAYGLRVALELEAEILRVGADKVAAFVAEPVAGATLGCVAAAPGYFKTIRDICDRYGVLFIADEVMCGMGRTGTLYACEHESVTPDLITCGKGLGAGYQPIGATLASERVVEAIAEGSGMLASGQTYMSHPVACAGALAVLEVIEEEDLLGNVRRRGEELRSILADRFAQHPHVGDIRGRGLFWALEIVQERDSKAPFPRRANLAGRIKAAAQEHGLLCYPGQGCADGEHGDIVILAPVYSVRTAQLDEMAGKLDAAIKASL